MKAIVYHEYGSPDVLHIEEVAKPVPKENEVLIRVHATPVNYGDLIARNFKNIPAREFNMPLAPHVAHATVLWIQKTKSKHPWQ